ncbi:MAG: DEAD/DEAH box helicase, partial [Propionibacteriaceae bacterium]
SSAKPALDVVLWEPEMSLYADASRLLAQLVDEGQQTLAFVPSRIMAERVAIQASEKISSDSPIVSYRAGYLATDRRTLEHGLQQGKIRGVAATNALELGVDISGMDAVVIAGFPGTLSSLWQQIGRAGRAGSDALAILVAKPDPLDAYLMEHPQLIFEAPVETTVMDPENPNILGPQLCAAAQEEPLTEADSAWFGPSMITLAERLAAVKLLRRRPQGWFWTKTEWAVNAIDLRSMGGKPFHIIDTATGRVLGQADPAQADKSLFPGAVYLHQGDPWLVDALDQDTRQAFVHADRPGYYTQAQGGQSITIVRELTRKSVGQGIVCFGDIELTSRVTHYLRRDEHSNDVWDETPVELPQRVLSTQALWWILPAAPCQRLGLKGSELGAAAHAAEHTAIGLLAAFATCDRWDIGGLSTVLHEDTGECTVFVHDSHPGGAGFAKAGYERVTDWLAAAHERLTDCECVEGCPSCCVSPKCGNQNQHLDKAAGAKLLTILLDQ